MEDEEFVLSSKLNPSDVQLQQQERKDAEVQISWILEFMLNIHRGSQVGAVCSHSFI